MRRKIQLFAAPFGICLDPAIGDGERLPIGKQDGLVGADTARGEFPDALV